MPEDPPPEGIPWLWRGTKYSTGYGQIVHDRKKYLAHRVSFELFVGPIPDGLEVRHKIDGIPLDVNPNNLEIGTHADNMNDALVRGRTARGTRLPHAKLTDKSVRQIRILYATNQYNQRRLAMIFGVRQQTIWAVVMRKTWKHVH
jgi:hypothetical protein